MDITTKKMNELSQEVTNLKDVRDTALKRAEDLEIAINEERAEFEKQREEHRNRTKELSEDARKQRQLADNARKDLRTVEAALSNMKITNKIATDEEATAKARANAEQLEEKYKAMIAEIEKNVPKEVQPEEKVRETKSGK